MYDLTPLFLLTIGPKINEASNLEEKHVRKIKYFFHMTFNEIAHAEHKAGFKETVLIICIIAI